MGYKVLLPAAGTGTRLGKLTKYMNKSLVGISNKPAICHVIEQFPDDCRFVIALGHKGDLLEDFLKMAYPQKYFDFVRVSPYEGEGSGLGLSILYCDQYLQEPFVFCSCDTLVKGDIPAPNHNWVGFGERDDISQYRTVRVENGQVIEFCDKKEGKDTSHKPYIGLAGIHDYKLFSDKMSKVRTNTKALLTGECWALYDFLDGGLMAYPFEWYDTGNPKELEITRTAYRQEDEPNILEKPNEAIWFIGDKVIKFSDDQKFIQNRVARVKLLEEFVPQIISSSKNLYCYYRIKGDVLSNIVTIPLFKNLLNTCENFWQLANLNQEEKQRFHASCMNFYKNKTLDRIELFYKSFNKKDANETINGESMPPLKEILNNLDWNWISDGLAGCFHGDFHFENILYTKETNKFTFIDWRQEFAGSLTTGDIYYDLAKLLHGLIISHELIAEDRYFIKWSENSINFDFNRKQMLVDCERFYYQWLEANRYDVKKVKVLTALIYLNIAALHHYPYGLLLYALGKKMLYDELKED